jgi:hypothetical protein
VGFRKAPLWRTGLPSLAGREFCVHCVKNWLHSPVDPLSPSAQPSAGDGCKTWTSNRPQLPYKDTVATRRCPTWPGEPASLPACCSTGVAEAFVKTFKRDYARLSILPDAETESLCCRLGSRTTMKFTRTQA